MRPTGRSDWRSGPHTPVCLWLLATIPLLVAQAQVQAEEVVCGDMDIRNSVGNLRKLENCTVVEGFLRILLINEDSAQSYDNMTFPALREITGYLLLYRAGGLTSVGKLFPNLVVIRGRSLFHNYALAIYEMNSLQEIGLHSLTNILRGHVRIEKNMALCYVETIDWGSILEEGPEGNYIQNNKDRNQCPDTCPADCPKNPWCSHGKGPWVGDRNCLLCWGPHKCQKVCKECNGERGVSCSGSESLCCSKECLGGCNGSRTSDCLACRHFVFEGKCMATCPADTYQYLKRRCITEEECRSMTRKVSEVNRPQQLKPFQGSCLTECPQGYTEKIGDPHSCAFCQDKCPKVCPKTTVESVAQAQTLRGCTTIDGHLEIQIQGGPNIIKELEENLKDIQEIKGYLKIARSPSLISLNFLKNLRLIRGEGVDRDGHSLLVLDNQNLQDLWEWKSRQYPLEIWNGKVFFHTNGKLCPEKIKDLKNSTYARVRGDWDDRDVSNTTNGDRVPCNVTNLEVKVFRTSHKVAILEWKNFQEEIADYRSIISYIIYYREAPNRNVTIFEGRDACSNMDGWKVQDVQSGNKGDKLVKPIIQNLKPYTQYAYYVQAYMISNAERGAQSKIQYFRTEPSTPKPPVKLKTESGQPTEIFVTWAPPREPNGIIANYTVTVIPKPDLPNIVFQRNYCDQVSGGVDYNSQSQMFFYHQRMNDTALSSTTASPPDQEGGVGGFPGGEECCSCERKKNLDELGIEKEGQIQFEDFLQNTVYIRNPSAGQSGSSNRSRRSIRTDSTNAPVDPALHLADLNTTAGLHLSSTPAPHDSNHPSIQIRVKNVSGEVNYLRVGDLWHFTEYAIEVKACQNLDPSSMNKMDCSINAISTVRTRPLAGADDILNASVKLENENISVGSVKMVWDPPQDPNGLIVSYQVEYKIVSEMDKSKPLVDCISGPDYSPKEGHRLTKLIPGRYSLRIRAVSLAWAGNWTPEVFVDIPAMPSDSSLNVLWIVIPVIFLPLLAFSVGGFYFFKRRFGMGVPDGILYASVNPEYMSAGLVYEPDEWEIPREKISLLRELGQGSFGMVYEGEAKDVQGKDSLQCAIKTVNESASVRERIEFLQEASVMKAFNCHHVVKLLGVVSKGHPTLVVMELMARGDLKSYLRSHRPDVLENEGRQPPSLRQILQMAIEIADGMAYLAAKKFVHRDLAARNCMVAQDLTVKIGDFGMTRDIYETDYYRKGGKGLLPVRWMAPESLKDGVFTSQSDVWSYGVVLWEMSTLACQPYQGLSNEQVLKYVINGGIMEQPENCPEKLYVIMKMCWHKSHCSRPTFSELIEVLLKDVSGHFRQVAFYFTERPKMMASKEEEPTLEVVTSSTPLKSPSMLDCASVNSRDNSDDDELDTIRYFPTSSTAFATGDDATQCANGIRSADDGPSHVQLDLNLGGSGKRNVSSNSEGSKGMSLPSSDGSKGSKVSSISNGSLANGHATVPFPSARTTTC